MNMRDSVRAGIQTLDTSILEIGPLYRPFFLKSEADVIYVDHADTETLREKYRVGHGFDVNEIVNVDAVWGESSLLECAGRKVDYVIASHVIEHVPDLITWMKELQAVLKPGGEIRLVVPDKRYTFDYIRRETALQDLIDPYMRRTRRPLPANIFDHVTYVRKVDVGEAWKGPLDPRNLEPLHSYEMAIGLVDDALSTENYHDVHCWVFTPYSFASLMIEASECGLLSLECVGFGDTPHNSLEFTVFVRPALDAAAITASWEHMRQSVQTSVEDSKVNVLLTDLLSQNESLLEDAASRVMQLTTELETCRVELELAKLKIAAYEHSRSWRLTAPLRAIQRRFLGRLISF